MRLAALDLGSNSFHLLVAEVHASGEVVKVQSQKHVLGLGRVVQRRGQLSSVAFTAAFACVSRLTEFARELRVEKVLAVATSALRDARNGAAFCERCRDALGVDIELLSGEEEARLAYLGARSALGALPGRALVADLGGGSLELAVGEDVDCDAVQSLPLGFLRLSQAFRQTDAGGLRRLSRYVQLECEKARWQLGRFERLLLSGGTARAIGKLTGESNAATSAARFIQLCDEVGERSPEQLQVMGVDATRARTLAAGAAVLSGLVASLGQRELHVSRGGLREGVLLRERKRRAPTRAA